MILGSPRRLACVIALLLVAAGCSSGSGGTGVEDSSRSPTPVGTTAPPRGESPGPDGQGGDAGADRPTPEVLRFSAPELGGGTVDGQDYSGRDVAIWFWAPW
jgi:hypothetical protein